MDIQRFAIRFNQDCVVRKARQRADKNLAALLATKSPEERERFLLALKRLGQRFAADRLPAWGRAPKPYTLEDILAYH